ncbi:hypothetical protein SD70_26860 [Gordoniibacillus kamchatkensis]|uniref:DUF192 domain-containing protein n=1 Tax=Gordoniibacillus kamchatkensis TaxID=1590651 RepID=A0ABR5AD90_9BACL|nr:DUF192 domain-containing protein [Paenibacillus sp. VKM B-2647]KIL38352.1 hypothetical protein SD70_26860 [Paenibacillus sp. VKM B-2647]
MKLVQPEDGFVLAERVLPAETFWRRLRGLLFTERFPEGCCLYLRPCRSVHTFWMRYDIDVVHVDGRMRITGMEPQLAPNKRGTVFRHTEAVIELPAGTIARSRLQVGQTLQFQP